MAQDAKSAPGAVQALWNPDRTDESSDAELLRHFLSRTDESAEAAFATLVERHGPIVHRVCRDILGNRHEAEDAAQAVFLVLARKARSIRKPESLGPWLHGVSLRVAKRARSDAARQRVAERRKAEIMQRTDHAECRPEPMDYSELHEEIDRLPEKYRQPIILCYMQGRTQPQAAQILGWPLGTVQIRLHRGRERLRSRLSRARAGLFAATGFELTPALCLPTRAPRPEWTETTARAAVRFAAGKATAGLVAPACNELGVISAHGHALRFLEGRRCPRDRFPSRRRWMLLGQHLGDRGSHRQSAKRTTDVDRRSADQSGAESERSEISWSEGRPEEPVRTTSSPAR